MFEVAEKPPKRLKRSDIRNFMQAEEVIEIKNVCEDAGRMMTRSGDAPISPGVAGDAPICPGEALNAPISSEVALVSMISEADHRPRHRDTEQGHVLPLPPQEVLPLVDRARHQDQGQDCRPDRITRKISIS